MTDSSTDEPEIVSPCVGVCAMNAETGYCLGCYRNRDEIAGWLYASRDQRLGIVRMIRERREAAGGTKRRRNRRRASRAAT